MEPGEGGRVSLTVVPLIGWFTSIMMIVTGYISGEIVLLDIIQGCKVRTPSFGVGSPSPYQAPRVTT